MTYPNIDEDYLILEEEKVYYKISSKHRESKPTVHASIWSVCNDSEVECFKTAITKNYIKDDTGWGYLLGEDGLISLGKCLHNGDLIDDLKIAKFKDGNRNAHWHGWPCNYKRTGDTPTDDVLEKWVENKIITRVKMQKIKQKQRCNL